MKSKMQAQKEILILFWSFFMLLLFEKKRDRTKRGLIEDGIRDLSTN